MTKRLPVPQPITPPDEKRGKESQSLLFRKAKDNILQVLTSSKLIPCNVRRDGKSAANGSPHHTWFNLVPSYLRCAGKVSMMHHIKYRPNNSTSQVQLQQIVWSKYPCNLQMLRCLRKLKSRIPFKGTYRKYSTPCYQASAPPPITVDYSKMLTKLFSTLFFGWVIESWCNHIFHL